jgi:hypothetical protein
MVVWLIAAKLHSHHPGHFRPYPLFRAAKRLWRGRLNRAYIKPVKVRFTAFLPEVREFITRHTAYNKHDTVCDCSFFFAIVVSFENQLGFTVYTWH